MAGQGFGGHTTLWLPEEYPLDKTSVRDALSKLLRGDLWLASRRTGEPFGVGLFQGVTHIGKFAVDAHREGRVVVGGFVLHSRCKFPLAGFECLNFGFEFRDSSFQGSALGGLGLAGFGLSAALGLDFLKPHLGLHRSLGSGGLGLEIAE
jgi:hypothetical protein